MKVLVACEYSGTVRNAFSKLGHEAHSCDLLPSESPGLHYQGDLFDIAYNKDWDIIIAHPPCTALCVTGNRHYSDSDKRLEAAQFVKRIWELPTSKLAIENPVGVLNSLVPQLPKPYYVQPWQFGHHTTKKTGLWTRGLPKLEPTNIVDPEEEITLSSGKKMSKWYYETSCLPQKDRATARSTTFQGIANAMAEQWGKV